MSQIKDNQYVILLFKMHYFEETSEKSIEFYSTLDKTNRIINTIDNKETYIQRLCSVLGIQNDNYKTTRVEKIIIEY
jgi:hypothetical protein